jgi:ribonuclease D
MDRRGLGVLKELWHWRDLEAVAANRPPFFILSHDSLLALAKTAALGEPFDKLIPARYSDRRRASLHKAIAHARALPAAKLPEPLRARGKRMTAVQRQRLEALRKTRDHHARDLSLDPAVIASRATLCALACDWDTNRQDLLPWQRELLAPAVG